MINAKVATFEMQQDTYELLKEHHLMTEDEYYKRLDGMERFTHEL